MEIYKKTEHDDTYDNTGIGVRSDKVIITLIGKPADAVFGIATNGRIGIDFTIVQEVFGNA